MTPKFWEATWKLLLEGLEEMHVKVHSSITYQILLTNFEELPICSHAYYGAFNKWPTHLSKQEFNVWHKLTTMWKTSWGLSHWETHDKPTTSKTIYNDIEAFLATKWNSLHISRKKLDSLHPKPLPPQPSTPPQHKNIVAYRTSNHRLAIEIGWWTIIHISRDTRLCLFCSSNVIEMRHICVGLSPM